MELRLDFGAGYRVYYAKYGSFIIILLGGGDKSTQRKDIADAARLWEGLKMRLRKFDDYLSERLCDTEYAIAYVETALEEGGVEEFLCALRKVAVAQGGTQGVAEGSRRGRENLHKSLSKKGNPRIKTLDDILHALGMRIAVTRDGAESERDQSQAIVIHARNKTLRIRRASVLCRKPNVVGLPVSVLSKMLAQFDVSVWH